MITYSFDKELKNCFFVNFGVYLKEIMGVACKSNYYETIYKSYIKATSSKTIIVAPFM